MHIIGITGGVGAGKSTVLALLQELCDCQIIMADDVAKELMQEGGTLSADAIRLFGPEAYLKGELNKSHIARMVYQDKELLTTWSQLVHPATNARIRELIDEAQEAGRDYAFIEAALLIENHYETICDEIWYIYAPYELRLARLMSSRGYTKEKVDSIEASQLSETEFKKHCQYIIHTDAELSQVRKQLENKLEEYKQL